MTVVEFPSRRLTKMSVICLFLSLKAVVSAAVAKTLILILFIHLLLFLPLFIDFLNFTEGIGIVLFSWKGICLGGREVEGGWQLHPC